NSPGRSKTTARMRGGTLMCPCHPGYGSSRPRNTRESIDEHDLIERQPRLFLLLGRVTEGERAEESPKTRDVQDSLCVIGQPVLHEYASVAERMCAQPHRVDRHRRGPLEPVLVVHVREALRRIGADRDDLRRAQVV